MATLTPVQAALVGANPGFVAATSGGDVVAPGDHTIVLVNNGSGSSINVTVDVPGNTQFGQAQPDVVVAVPAGTIRAIGPFPAGLANPSDQQVHLTYSAVTTVTVAAVNC